MSDIEKLENLYEREVKLARQHKDKAAELRQKIEESKGQAILKSIRNIKLSPNEFKKLQKGLANEADVKRFLAKIGVEENEKSGE